MSKDTHVEIKVNTTSFIEGLRRARDTVERLIERARELGLIAAPEPPAKVEAGAVVKWSRPGCGVVEDAVAAIVGDSAYLYNSCPRPISVFTVVTPAPDPGPGAVIEDEKYGVGLVYVKGGGGLAVSFAVLRPGGHHHTTHLSNLDRADYTILRQGTEPRA